jgi:hypothetical protein
VIHILAGIEQWPISVWAREDAYAYFVALIFHAWGMALLVGGGVVATLVAIASGAAGLGTRMRGIVTVMWVGFAMAAPSGLVLLVAYPAKALTNPVFAAKFACLIGAALLLRRQLRPDVTRGRAIAVCGLLLWLCGVAAGKMLLHTYRVLTVT